MRRLILQRLFLRRLAFVSVVFLLSACAIFRDDLTPPDVALAGLHPGPGDGLSQTVFVDLLITNPNNIALKLNAISYRVRIEGRDLVSGTSHEPLEIAAGGSQKYTVPATLSLMSGFGLIRDIISKPKNKFSYELNATLTPSGLFSIPISVKKSDTLSLQ